MYAHSIKNPHIIHAVEKQDYFIWNEYGYICCGCFTPEKVATKPSEVTCKNCLRLMGEL